ncbi:MAG: succinyl-diaminopimelate desuccinylase [Gammaproteobacteria bacterium]|nr:succinyl-diaminopimelate desuccinylase [Gammaproteobacteria bacterium]
MAESATLSLAKALIERASVTPQDAGCQLLLAGRLRALGFATESLRFGEVENLWARHGKHGRLFVFAGHTDVVPTGPETQWQSPPFQAAIRANKLYGRGSADMKGSIAAMVTATERFLQSHPAPTGSIGFLLTSDEEGPSIDGTVKVIQTLQQRQEKIDWCLVGEPTSTNRVGDVIKNGRRGSLSGKLIIHGVQGHVAYPHLADNPIHAVAPVLQELCQEVWDHGTDYFPATTFQISNLHAGTGATNVIPGELELQCNFRFSTAVTEQQLRQRVEALLMRHKLRYSLTWTLSGNPYLTPVGELVQATRTAIQQECGYATELSTSGGTSDGRFIAPTGAQVLELGPLNASIHKIDEHVALDDLETLSRIYERILNNLLT